MPHLHSKGELGDTFKQSNFCKASFKNVREGILKYLHTQQCSYVESQEPSEQLTLLENDAHLEVST